MAKKIIGGLVVTLLAASFGTGYGQDALIAGYNIVGNPGMTSGQVLAEAQSMLSSMRSTTKNTLKNEFSTQIATPSAVAEIVNVAGKDVVYAYVTIWLVGGPPGTNYGTVPEDATTEALLQSAVGGLAWTTGTVDSCSIGRTESEATSTSAQSTSSGVQSVGDPHLQNIHGERFDVMKPGEHVLIHIPRQERLLENSLLHVQAVAQTLGALCEDTYFVRINVTGKWPSALRPGGFIFNAEGPDSGAESKWMSLHGLSNGLQMKVVRGQTQRGTRYLNFYIKHLDRTGFPVGGLLGEDDHEDVSTLPRACERRLALKLSVGAS